MAFIADAFTAGQTLTAASMEALRGNANAGHNVFTNEAARDAAITAPTEGTMAYLTAPTVPAATGGTTSIPTGVITIYNGSVWVCVTPVSGFTSNTGTLGLSGYTATLSGSPGTNPSVTLVTGTTALVSTAAIMSNSGTFATSVSVAVSGAGTVAASNNYSLDTAIAANLRFGSTFVIPGLTAGTNTFTLQYASNGNTASISMRHITVQGIA